VTGAGARETDEIASGPAGAPRGSPGRNFAAWSWARRAGTVVALVAAAVWLTRSVGGAGHPAARTTAPPTASAPATATSSFSLDQAFVEVSEICPPVTDGVHSLVVSFILRNISAVPVAVLSVQPLLPLHGLSAVATDISGGSCARTTGAPAGLALAVGGQVVVSFRFVLPGTCPQALPIQARTQILVGPAQSAAGPSLVQDDLPVLNDLGAIRFDTCPAST